MVDTEHTPELIRSAIYDVHMLTDSMPDDRIYEMCADVVDYLCDNVEFHGGFMDIDLWHTVADLIPSIYSHELRKWFAEYPDAAGYVARACEEFGSSSAVTGDIHEDISRAWYLAVYEACGELAPALAELAGEI